MKRFQLLFIVILFFSCNNPKQEEVLRIGFLDFIEDATIAQAKDGFLDALNDNGYSDGDNYELIYANAQGDIPTLTQSCDYILAKDVKLIATNVTLSTITAVQKTNDIPVFMMVSPAPEMAGLLDKKGKAPGNLYGVYETLDYLDVAVDIIRLLSPEAKRIATIYNQAEPQSVMAYERLQSKCELLGLDLVSATVTNSSETQLITMSLLNKDVDAFFALPDNIIFASFETIIDACNNASVPVYTSEAGLVARGAVASYGADFYKWGYQSGMQAVQYLKTGSLDGLKPEIVKDRVKTINITAASRFNITADSSFVIFR